MIGFLPIRCPATAGPELEILASSDICHFYLAPEEFLGSGLVSG